MMTGYLDESFNSNTVMCGGWIAKDKVWDQIIQDWSRRIAYENRISAKRNLKPISRYHAADCSSRVNEFQGWTVARQIRFVKKLQDIMTAGEAGTRSHTRPMIFGWGASIKESRILLPDVGAKQRRQFCYKMCVYDCLREIGRVMREFHTQDRITFLHDRGELAYAAQEAFDDVINKFDFCKEHFVAMVPIGWEHCVPLQPADMVAYDLMKQIDKRLIGIEDIRRSLQRIVGTKVPIVAGCLKPGGFKQLREWWEADQLAVKGA